MFLTILICVYLIALEKYGDTIFFFIFFILFISQKEIWSAREVKGWLAINLLMERAALYRFDILQSPQTNLNTEQVVISLLGPFSMIPGERRSHWLRVRRFKIAQWSDLLIWDLPYLPHADVWEIWSSSCTEGHGGSDSEDGISVRDNNSVYNGSGSGRNR